MGVIVYDLDGCLSDDRWRLPLIDEENGHYSDYHRAAHQDLPVNIDNFLRDLGKTDASVIIITSRPESCRAITREWLKRCVGSLSKQIVAVRMRPNGNTEPSPVLKPKMLQSVLDSMHVTAEDVLAAYDDREDVLAAYAEMGVKRLFKAGITGVPSAGLGFIEEFKPHGTEPRSHPPQETAPGVTAADVLQGMADTYRERNKVYGSNYQRVAPVMKELFPDGVPSELVLSEHWHLFELLVVKLTRFANSHLSHEDSIHDAAVYAAMIEAAIKEQ